MMGHLLQAGMSRNEETLPSLGVFNVRSHLPEDAPPAGHAPVLPAQHWRGPPTLLLSGTPPP